VVATGAGPLTQGGTAMLTQQRRRQRHMDRKLTNRAIAKEMRLRVNEERALARRQRKKMVRQVFIFLVCIFMSQLINSMGGKSFVSFSVSV